VETTLRVPIASHDSPRSRKEKPSVPQPGRTDLAVEALPGIQQNLASLHLERQPEPPAAPLLDVQRHSATPDVGGQGDLPVAPVPDSQPDAVDVPVPPLIQQPVQATATVTVSQQVLNTAKTDEDVRTNGEEEKPVEPSKPFRLDSSESSIECPVSGRVSGPPGADEDSDSFWN